MTSSLYPEGETWQDYYCPKCWQREDLGLCYCEDEEESEDD